MSHVQNIVQTNLGLLQGKVNIASDGQEYYAFHGVPFAQPPIGELRFKAPKPVQPWCGILDATVEGSECVSHDLMTQQRIGSENCLNLNVYTHSITPGVKKPVMVFIHGGLFVGGSNKTEQHGPDFFMCEDVVLVIPNYRLGIFGFLALHDKSLGVPGNAGLKDQVMALRWVQENIEFFGGNPNNVTLFGGSAGGASVNYLQCSPMAVGLFHKVIIQSGCASAHWAGGQIHPFQIDTHLKMEGKSEKELLEKMMTLNEEELFAVQYACKFSKRVTDERPLGPVVEGFNPYEPSFLVEDPVKIFESGNYIKVPMILGYNSKEGIMVEVASGKKFRLLSNFDITVPYKYGFERYGNTWKSVGNKIKTFYHGADNPVLMSSVDNFRNLIGDLFFVRPMFEELRRILASNPCPIYFYRFAFEGELNLYKNMSGVQGKGVTHSDEIFYMFKTAITPDVEPTSREAITIKRIIQYWTNFAKSSNPNPRQLNDIFTINWPPTDGIKLLNIDDELTVIDLPEINRMHFWDKIDAISRNKL